MNKFIFPALFLALCLSLKANPTTVSALNIGTNPVPDGNIAVGYSNFRANLTPSFNVAIGDLNFSSIDSWPWGELAIGSYNESPNGYRNILVGAGNYNDMFDSAIIGYANYSSQYGGLNWQALNGWGGGTSYASVMIGTSNHAAGLYSSLMIGSGGNAIEILNSVVSGYLNYLLDVDATLISGTMNTGQEMRSGLIAGYNNYGYAGRQFILGEGLVAYNNPLMVVVGQYNTVPTAGQLFIVGNGTIDDNGSPATISRANAFEIYGNGAIKIPKRQGDIAMGEFGNGNGD